MTCFLAAVPACFIADWVTGECEHNWALKLQDLKMTDHEKSNDRKLQYLENDGGTKSQPWNLQNLENDRSDWVSVDIIGD